VIGASGFVGSRVARQLVDRGDDMRVLIRPTSSTKAIDDLAKKRGPPAVAVCIQNLAHRAEAGPWQGRSRPRGKADRDLGWQPEPIHDSIRRAAKVYLANRPK
jgi:nucleoside-diphosphate-sugar epimerase